MELLSIFSIADIKRQYNDSRYPFNCDFYIISCDMFIECNFHWAHGKHRFEYNNPEDKAELCRILERMNTSTFYKTYYEVWAERDIAKYNYAISNNLNYVTLYNLAEEKKFINDLRIKNNEKEN